MRRLCALFALILPLATGAAAPAPTRGPPPLVDDAQIPDLVSALVVQAATPGIRT